MNEYLRVFRALSDENRIKILEKLSEGEQCACCLLEGLEISQSTLSHHMKILCESGLVRGERVGVWMYYSIDGEGCCHAGKLLDSVANGDMKRWLKFFGIFAFIKKLLVGEETARETDVQYICCDYSAGKAAKKC